MAPLDIRFLSNEQFLIFTMLAQLAVVAALATMFARFRRFRRLLLTEKRDWPERLAFAGALGIPLFAGAVSRILLGYNGQGDHGGTPGPHQPDRRHRRLRAHGLGPPAARTAAELRSNRQ